MTVSSVRSRSSVVAEFATAPRLLDATHDVDGVESHDGHKGAEVGLSEPRAVAHQPPLLREDFLHAVESLKHLDNSLVVCERRSSE